MTESEMAKHKHGITSSTPQPSSGVGYWEFTKVEGWAVSPTHNMNGIETDYHGASTPFNIMQPYITCYMWKRTA